jgi:DNA polymerase III subunit beta
MKFTANRAALLKAITFASSCSQGRTTLPVLNCLAFTAEFDRLSICGTNLDLWGTAQCEANIADVGGCCIPAALISSFVKSAATGEISIEIVKQRVRVQSGKSKAEIPIMDLAELPKPQNVKGAEIMIPADVFKSNLDQVKRAQSIDPSRQVINSVFAEFKSGKLALVATDGRRLTAVEFECAGDGQYIVPTSVVERLLAVLESGDVKCTFGENQVRFDGSNWTIHGRLIDGSYPNWRQIIPNKIKQTVAVPLEELVSTVRRAKVFTTDKVNCINLEFSRKSLTIRARTPEHEFEETIEDLDAFDFKIACDATYLLDLLAGVKGEIVNLGLIDEMSPIVIKEDTYTGVVMPMRLA